MENNLIDNEGEDGTPFPEFLIKSIAEQGYSLETSLADLIDNAVSAGADRIEILINTENIPFTLFLTDNGNGMNEEQLKKAMHFPSTSMENERVTHDLGRFGLGMKTASFAQTRKLSVLSRQKDEKKFAGRTWDVNYLKLKKRWLILVNDNQEITNLLEEYDKLTKGFLNEFIEYVPNTIVAWQGLYKFEEYLKGNDKSNSLKTQINEITTEYLSLVFHRFMERSVKPLKIRVNNVIIQPFNPFPSNQPDLRLIESMQRGIENDVIKLEGFVLPVRSIDESKEINNIWSTKNKGLMDMEGLYIYRADRIILFGGWNGIIRKSPRLQLARLRVEVGNKVDNLLHLNVAKSQISIPYDLRVGFLKYMSKLKDEAEKEYYNRGIRKITSKKSDSVQMLFDRNASNKGTILEINADFPIVKLLEDSLNPSQKKSFALLKRMINTTINKMRNSHNDKSFSIQEASEEGLELQDLIESIQNLLKMGTNKETIKNTILPALGFRIDTIPTEINKLLK
jgi:small nuclear ribonucleoprotein (snRNP)-like protein